VTGLDERFQEYFAALERAGNRDRCFLCRRTPADVKRFFGFDEDGVPLAAAEYALEDVALEATDIMSYRGARPVCAVCQLNLDAIFLLGEHAVLRQMLEQMEHRREELWPAEEDGAA
jgi:hypothetical protein